MLEKSPLLEKRRTIPDSRGRRSSRREAEQPAEISDSKGLYLQNARWRSEQREENKWHRAVSSGEEIVTKLPTNFFILHTMAGNLAQNGWVSQVKEVAISSQEVEGNLEKFDLFQFAKTLPKEGRKLVIEFLRRLKDKDISNSALHAVHEAFIEASGLQEKGDEAGKGNISVESFLVRAHRLDKQGQAFAALDLIYDSVDENLRMGKFQQLDSILAQEQIADLSVDLLLGILTATLPARSQLPSRQKIFEKIKNTLIVRGEYEDGLLVGLEG